MMTATNENGLADSCMVRQIKNSFCKAWLFITRLDHYVIKLGLNLF